MQTCCIVIEEKNVYLFKIFHVGNEKKLNYFLNIKFPNYKQIEKMIVDIMGKYADSYQYYIDENPGISGNKKTIKYGDWNCYFVQDKDGTIY